MLGGDPWTGWAMGLGGWVLMLFFWSLAVLGAVFLVLLALGWGRSGGAVGGEPPLEILKRRYASGDITREEYERVRTDLE